jgi:amidase
MRPNRQYGHVRAPSLAQVHEYARRHHFEFDEDEAASLVPILARMMRGFDSLDELPEPQPAPSAFTRRRTGHSPSAAEDPYNAFIRLCEVAGAEQGPLAGLTAAVKDCIAVAGVPLTNGSRMLPTFVPTEDAVVVDRILRDGAVIVGKTNMEDLAMGGGEGSVYGPAKNPVDPRFATGGSSSGSAAAVAAGMVDFALGADEAGSVRIPAAWCGLVGMKASHGLVPSYGLSYMDHTMDHIGPITRTVSLNARVLESIAGPDWRDAQWVRGETAAGSYSDGLEEGVAGMRLAVIEEALAPAGCTPDVLAAFEDACDVLRAAGAIVETVSVPLWAHAPVIWGGFMPFALRAMADSAGAGYGHKGRINVPATEATAAQLRGSANDLAIMAKLNLLVAEHLRDQYLGVHYGKAQNLRLELTRQLEAALGPARALLTPTTPTVATELSDERFSMLEMLARRAAGSSTRNTCALDLSGHPALTVPIRPGRQELPVGCQIIGGLRHEATLYRIGAVLEDAGLWSAPASSRGPRVSL